MPTLGLTVEDLRLPGPPIRISTLVKLTPFNRWDLYREIQAGELRTIRRLGSDRAMIWIDRGEAVRWLEQVGLAS